MSTAMPPAGDTRRILQAIDKLKRRVAELEAERHEPIAIVGMGCRMPGGASDPARLWAILRDGVDAVTEIPADRWDVDAYHDPDPEVAGKTYVRHGGFLPKPDAFDAGFFGISPREAVKIDPLQRLLLEVGWEALEHAAVAPGSLAGSRTGVFVGIGESDYALLQQNAGLEAIDAYAATGTPGNFAAGRLSYALGLRGPSLGVDTACSSSLVAIHLACQSLRAGDCTWALAGGVSLMLSPLPFVGLSRLRALAPDGRCKTFSAEADGYGRGEGCGMLVLRRLTDAVRDGDRVLAVIRGSAVNHGGHSSGLTVPHGPAQQSVVRQALADARLAPAEVDYVEAHGTGTSLGDPIEVHALAAVYGEGRAADRPLRLGTVKANIGHLEAASGVAGILKTVLALQHGELPAQLHASTLSRNVDWDDLPVAVVRSRQPWTGDVRPRRAGVSSFGISGTNAHVILEEAPPAEVAPVSSVARPLHVVAVGAKTPAALAARAASLAAHLRAGPPLADIADVADVADVAFSANTARDHFEHRLAVVAGSAAEMADALEARTGARAGRPRVAFLFTGNGVQYAGMGRALYDTQPVFRAALDRCAAIVDPLLGRSLLDAMFAGDGTALEETANGQPALFAIEWALWTLWRSWGVEPDAVMGHSLGELVAACAAGVFSLEDGLALVAARGRLMQALPTRGAMFAIHTSEARVASALAGTGVSIAAINAPGQVVIAGDEDAVAALASIFAADGIETRKLRVPCAFHSALMDPMLDDFERAAGAIRYSALELPLISNVTGQRAGAEVATAAYWRRHVRQPVRFADGVRALASVGPDGIDTFVEVGPHAALLAAAAENLPEVSAAWLPSLRKGKDDWATMLASAAALYERGVAIDWRAFDAPYARRHVDLPTYPWQRQRYWIDEAPVRRAIVAGRSVGALSGQRVGLPGDVVYQIVKTGPAHQPYLIDHQVHGRVVVPGAFYVSVVLAIAVDRLGARDVWMRDIEFVAPLLPGDAPDDATDVHVVLTPDGQGGYRFVVATEIDDGGDEPRFREHARGALTLNAGGVQTPGTANPSLPLSALLDAHAEPVSPSLLYDQVTRARITWGPLWRRVSELRGGPASLVGRLEGDASLRAPLHPVVLDSAFAVALGAWWRSVDGGSDTPFVPWSLASFRWHGTPIVSAWSRGAARGELAPTDVSLSGDVTLLDDDGRVLAEVEGLTVKRADISAFFRAADAAAPALCELAWQVRPALAAAGVPAGPWLLFLGTDDVSREIRRRFRAAGAPCVVAFPGDAYREIEPGVFSVPASDAVALRDLVGRRAPAGIVYGWGLDASVTQEAALDGALHLVHALDALSSRSARLWIATRGAQAVGAPSAIDLAHAPLWGLGRVIALEHPELRCARVDLDPARTASTNVDALLAELVADGDEDQVALRGDARHVLRIAPHIAPPAPAPVFGIGRFRPDASYLVTGGLGGVGLTLARWLVDEGARHVVLVGRSAPSAEASAALDELRARGASVHVAAVDVADRAQVDALIARIGVDQPPLRGVFHLAAVLRDATLLQQTAADLRAVLGPKAGGAWHLHEATRDLPLEAFVLFSSLASLVGSPGQGNYAAANAFLDALAHHRAALGLPALSVGLGPVAGVGLAARAANQKRIAANGLGFLEPDDVMALLGRALDGSAAHVGALPVDVRHWAERTPALRALPVFRGVVRDPGRGDAPRGVAVPGALRARIVDAPHDEQRSVLFEHLRAQLALALQTDAAMLGGRTDFATLGLDSLMALEIRSELEASLALTLQPTLLLTHQSLDELTDALLTLLAPATLSPHPREEVFL